jgi:hypothetical protein
VTLIVYLGGATYLLDQYLIARRARLMMDFGPDVTPEPSGAHGH